MRHLFTFKNFVIFAAGIIAGGYLYAKTPALDWLPGATPAKPPGA